MNKIKIPKGWDEVFIDQFKALNDIDFENESIHSIQLERLSILSDIPSDDVIWDDMDIRELNTILSQLKFLHTKPSLFVCKEIMDNEFRLIDFNNLTLGEFIHIEFLLKDGSENKNIDEIACILYRKYKEGDWAETIFEPYSAIDFEKRKEYFLNNCKLTEIFGAINSYREWREEFLKIHSSMFQPEIEDDYDVDEMDEQELLELKELEEQEKKMAEFGWQRLLLSISDGDVLKIDEYLKMGIIFLFNMISVKKSFKR